MDVTPSPAAGMQPTSSRTSGSAPWRVYLEIRLNGGPSSRRVLAETHLVIGRVPGVQILLDHHTVSRRHAEMYCDPFGRWWIRDLGQHERDARQRRARRPSTPSSPATASPSATSPSRSASRPATAAGRAATPSRTRTISPPPSACCSTSSPRASRRSTCTRCSSSASASSPSRAPEERLDALCQLMVRGDFHGTAAVVLRLDADGTIAPISHTYLPGPMATAQPPYISRRVLAKVLETNEPVISGNVGAARARGSSVELTLSRDVMALWVVACPLRVGEGDAPATSSTSRSRPTAAAPSGSSSSRWRPRCSTRARRRGPRGATRRRTPRSSASSSPRGKSRTRWCPSARSSNSRASTSTSTSSPASGSAATTWTR